jgi:DNA repair protein RadC
MGKATRAALELTAPAADDDALLAPLAAGLRLQSNDSLWKVTGNTLAHRTLLRDAGGTWNRLDQCWEFAGDDPTEKLAAALEAVPAAAGHNSGEPAPPKPHYHGHRGRVRERVLKAGIESLPDYELLELLLFYAIDRIDTKPLAKRLLERFGTLGDVFAAEPAQLREFEIDQRTLVMFRAVRESGRRLAERKVKDMPVLTNWQQLIDYCHAALAHEKTEQFRILFLDRKNVLIADEVQQRGAIDHTPVYPREVVKRALDLGAAALILVHKRPAHNHSLPVAPVGKGRFAHAESQLRQERTLAARPKAAVLARPLLGTDLPAEDVPLRTFRRSAVTGPEWLRRHGAAGGASPSHCMNSPTCCAHRSGRAIVRWPGD